MLMLNTEQFVYTIDLKCSVNLLQGPVINSSDHYLVPINYFQEVSKTNLNTHQFYFKKLTHYFSYVSNVDLKKYNITFKTKTFNCS